jgi:hypothetical protein
LPNERTLEGLLKRRFFKGSTVIRQNHAESQPEIIPEAVLEHRRLEKKEESESEISEDLVDVEPFIYNP